MMIWGYMSERTEPKYKDEDINLTLHEEISVNFRKSDIDSFSKKRNKTLVIFVKKNKPNGKKFSPL